MRHFYLQCICPDEERTVVGNLNYCPVSVALHRFAGSAHDEVLPVCEVFSHYFVLASSLAVKLKALLLNGV